jgi:hypothetical protein
MDELDWDGTSGERLLLRTFRQLLAGAECAGSRVRFEEACGCAGAQAFRAFTVFVQQLRLHGRRRIHLSPPASTQRTDDEDLVLSAFASAQADDYRSVDDALTRLTAAEPPGALGGALCLVAEAFAMNGLVLPIRPGERTRTYDGPELRLAGCF